MNVKLTFDPQAESEIIREVFADDTARTLWLGVKRGHVVSTTFSEDCLAFAKVLDKLMPESAWALFLLLSGGFAWPRAIIGHGKSEEEFAEGLLPYLTGRQTILYEVVNNG